MISDAKMRAHLLSALHGLRNSNTGWVPVSDMNFGGLEPVSPGRILSVCEQLAEAGLIVFKPAPGGPDGGFVGMSKITGHGCDVVDGLAAPRIALEFPQKKQSEPVPVCPCGETGPRRCIARRPIRGSSGHRCPVRSPDPEADPLGHGYRPQGGLPPGPSKMVLKERLNRNDDSGLLR
jgi:hypothetical protein